MRTLFAVLAAALVAASGAAARTSPLHVYAATSLASFLPQFDNGAIYRFEGSSKLAALIEGGAHADVFASANTSDPAALYAKGLVTQPVVFAHNSVVIVTPPANPGHVRSIAGLARHGVKVEIADTTVALGRYTLQILSKFRIHAVLANVVNRDDDVRAVIAKVEAGKVGAALVYASDAQAAGAKVHVVLIPKRVQPAIAYAAAVVKASTHQAEAAAFVRSLRSPRAQRALRAAGFR